MTNKYNIYILYIMMYVFWKQLFLNFHLINIHKQNIYNIQNIHTIMKVIQFIFDKNNYKGTKAKINLIY